MESIGKKAQKETKILACPIEGCGRHFRTQFSFNRHMLIHSGIKRFTCKYCEKQFSLLQYLKEHQYRHTGELPYNCGVSNCTMRFRQAGKLSLHRKTHPEYITKKYYYTLNKDKGVDGNERSKVGSVTQFNESQVVFLNHNETSPQSVNVDSKITTQKEVSFDESKINPRITLSLEKRVGMREQLSFPKLQDIQDHTIHSPSTEISKQGTNRINNITTIDPLDSFIKVLARMTSNKSKVLSKQFSTLNLFSLVNNFNH